MLLLIGYSAAAQTTSPPAPAVADDGEPYGGVSIHAAAAPGVPPAGNSGNTCQPVGGLAAPCVLTGQYSRYRTSANTTETTLADFTGSSQASPFGLANFYQFPANTLPKVTQNGPGRYNFEPVVAQPLYITDVPINSVSTNILLAASLDDWVYAFNTATGVAAWPPINLAYNDCGGSAGSPFDNYFMHNPGSTNVVYYGVVATPVIDIYSNTAQFGPTAFVVSACVTLSTSNQVQWNLDAINLETGSRIGHAVIQATGFNPSYQLSRASLLLTHPTTSTTDVYVAFGTGAGELSADAPCPSGFPSCTYSGWLILYSITYNSSSSVTFSSPTAFATSGQTNTSVFPSPAYRPRYQPPALRSFRCNRHAERQRRQLDGEPGRDMDVLGWPIFHRLRQRLCGFRQRSFRLYGRVPVPVLGRCRRALLGRIHDEVPSG
jgi:hypothetical protein